MSKKNQVGLIISVFCIFLYFYFINIAPESNITERNIFQQLSPQGFAFYSKNPRDETFHFETEQHLQVPNMQMANFFGLKRTGRAQGIELGKFQEEIPKGNWKTCSSEKECKSVKKNLKINTIKKNKNFRSLEKGTYYIYSYKPLSWHFREYEASSTIKKNIAKVVLE
ncbi:SdpA family antimicrobial peptide system protein [Viridibacillus sp. YIM B01967]|uniref:SdpA family antimicrobial peptide system protein n=1 Tax=Viridibacillus soli TaxID=2798301 RepID=A0ABS1H832_9BACL|nr:SdpA family antimicrobial peptide system protein [Viridibacillus soli]MBK3495578.1 SdpA family antimicrobial peptide system protein [Viridibacillus soli]